MNALIATSAIQGHGLGGAGSSEVSPETYWEIYRRFGRLQDNHLIREVREQLMQPSWLPEINTARSQQGLLHLHSLLVGAGSG